MPGDLRLWGWLLGGPVGGPCGGDGVAGVAARSRSSTIPDRAMKVIAPKAPKTVYWVTDQPMTSS